MIHVPLSSESLQALATVDGPRPQEGIGGQELHTPRHRLQQPWRIERREGELPTGRLPCGGPAKDAFQIGDEIGGAERAARRPGGSDGRECGGLGIALDVYVYLSPIAPQSQAPAPDLPSPRGCVM